MPETPNPSGIPETAALAPQWYYVLAGQRQGPVDEGIVESLIGAGQIRPETQVWTQGMSQWQPVGSIPRWQEALWRAAAAGVGGAPPVMPGPVVIGDRQVTVRGYAGFWMRFVAFLIDGAVLTGLSYVVVCVAGLPVGLIMSAGRRGGLGLFTNLADIFVFCLQMGVPWLYYALMESSARQGTLGKMALGLRVTTLEGQRISFGRASGRYFSKFISAAILMIGYIMAAFTEKKQALHDMIAGTLVMVVSR